MRESAAPGSLLFLSRSDVQQALDIPAMLLALENAFTAFSGGGTDVPARTAARTDRGLLASMPGFVEGMALGLKAVSVFPENHEHGIPSHQAIILLCDPETGTPYCVMDGAYITAMRTAGGSAVSVRLLAREDSRVLAILGSGVQAHSHLEVVTTVRGFQEIRIWSRTQDHAAELANLDPRARPVTSVEDATKDADVVCACTHPVAPILSSAPISAGAHVTSVGFGPEIDADLVGNAHVFVEWRGAASSPPPAGAEELQNLDSGQVTELGEVLSGSRPGRTSASEITLYKSTGHAMEDLATARLVYDVAVEKGLGVRIDLG